MIGKEDNQEEVSFKVADRRKFNADGSLKDGVTLESAKPEVKPAAEEKTPADQPVAVKTEDNTPPGPPADEAADDDAAFDDIPGADEAADDDAAFDDIPGADDPTSFVNFLSTLATNAAAALGAVPHPATGKRTLDLETAKYWLDILGMLRDKTAGNLHPQEARLLDGLLGDMRIQYVQLVRATEEKLKAEAAQKFSGADILGKK